MRKYMSKRQRPCDFCRSRKTACRIEGCLPCRLCALHGKQCTFVESTQPRRRTVAPESDGTSSYRQRPATDQGEVEVSPSNNQDLSLIDQDEVLQPSPSDYQPGSLFETSEQGFLFENIADQFFDGFGESEYDVQLGQTCSLLEGEPDPGIQLERTDTLESTDLLDKTPIGVQLDSPNSLHPQALGHSGDMDPYLLRNYQYDLSGAYKFKHLSIHSVSDGRVPVQFLLSESGLFSHSREEMGLRHTSIDASKKELESLVTLDIGLRLIALFRRHILPQYPIFSDLQFPNPQSSPPYLLAALYMVAQPFSRLDDVLSIELAYETLNNQGLFKIIEDALRWEAHNPSLSIVQTMLLLVVRPSTNPLVLESSSKWSSHGTLVAMCQSLGLHHDPSAWNIVPWQISLRRRISCTVFSLDKWLASTLGRPPLITRDAWLVTSLTMADIYDSGMNPNVWSQCTMYAKLGTLLGDTLSKLL